MKKQKMMKMMNSWLQRFYVEERSNYATVQMASEVAGLIQGI